MWRTLALISLFSLPGVPGWSDRLFVADRQKCVPKEDLIEAANGACRLSSCQIDACAQNVSEFIVDARLCKHETYSDITFTCSPETDFVVPRQFFDENFRDLNVFVLKQIVRPADSSDPLDIDVPSSPLAAGLSKMKLAMGIHFLKTMMKMSTEYYQYVTMIPPFAEQPPNGTFVSRNEQLFNVMREIMHLTEKRSELLVSYVADLSSVGNHSLEPSLNEFDVENFLKENEICRQFPQMKGDIESLYVNFLRNHTFGIDWKHLNYMNESNAHQKLIAQYKEVYTVGNIDFKYMDMTGEEFPVNNTWSDVLTAKSACLSSPQFAQIAIDLCQRDPLMSFYNFTKKTSLLSPDALTFELQQPCDAANATFREMTMECRLQKHVIQTPPRELGLKLFRRVHRFALGEYATAVRRNVDFARHQEEHRVHSYGHFMTNYANQDFDVVPLLSSTLAGYRQSLQAINDELVESRESKLSMAFAMTRFLIINERMAALYSWATKLMRNESIAAEEMKTFNVEEMQKFNVHRIGFFLEAYFPKIDSVIDGEEIRRYYALWYVEFCKDHTPGVDRKHLDFLSEPNSHLKLADLYKKVFSLGSFDLSFSELL